MVTVSMKLIRSSTIQGIGHWTRGISLIRKVQLVWIRSDNPSIDRSDPFVLSHIYPPLLIIQPVGIPDNLVSELQQSLGKG